MLSPDIFCGNVIFCKIKCLNYSLKFDVSCINQKGRNVLLLGGEPRVINEEELLGGNHSSIKLTLFYCLYTVEFPAGRWLRERCGRGSRRNMFCLRLTSKPSPYRARQGNPRTGRKCKSRRIRTALNWTVDIHTLPRAERGPHAAQLAGSGVTATAQNRAPLFFVLMTALKYVIKRDRSANQNDLHYWLFGILRKPQQQYLGRLINLFEMRKNSNIKIGPGRVSSGWGSCLFL